MRRMLHRLQLLVPLLFTASAACGPPPRTVAGTVTSTDPACVAKDPARRAMAGATVRIECPKAEQGMTLKLTTDAQGNFRADKPPPVPLECSIVVEGGDGALPRRFAVRDHCASDFPGPIWDEHPNTCHNLWLDATLFRSPQPVAQDGGAP